ncbi:MAG: universal stress protein [Candidatus Hydrothermarchaeales archaeon]
MKVLMCTGGSKFAENAIGFGIRLVKNVNPEITLLYVAERERDIAKSNDILDRAKDIIEDYGMTSKIKMREGFVAEEVIREAEEGTYDLVIIGSHGLRSNLVGISEFLLGTEAYRIVKYCKTSVLVVKEAKTFGKVLFTTDGSRFAEEAIEFGGRLLQKTSVDVAILHVIPSFVEHFRDYLEPVRPELVEMLKMLPRREAGRLDRSKEILRKYDIEAKRKVREGHAAEEILKESERYDMIVIAALGRSGKGIFPLGDIAYKVVTHAKKPVLLVKSIR